ncbi:lysine/histidine transporter 5-like protein, partial [Trifolium pratense]
EMSGGNANVNQNVQQDVEREGGAANNNNNNQQNLENWLPVSASRKAKWWYSTFHNVTAMVGAGVLSLPYALSQLGWYFSDFSVMASDILLTVATSANA